MTYAWLGTDNTLYERLAIELFTNNYCSIFIERIKQEYDVFTKQAIFKFAYWVFYVSITTTYHMPRQHKVFTLCCYDK